MSPQLQKLYDAFYASIGETAKAGEVCAQAISELDPTSWYETAKAKRTSPQ